MDEKKIREDLSRRKNELLETVTAINGILPQYMDDCIDDYKERPSIKTDWLNKKMNKA